MNRLQALLPPVVVALLVGCSSQEPDPPGQIGGEPASCEPTTSTELGTDEVSPLGFAASDILAFAGGAHTAPFVWDDGQSTGVTVLVSEAAAVRYADLGAPPPGGAESAAEIGCASHLQIDVALSIATTDGSFDEVFDATLVASDTSIAHWAERADIAALAGSYVFDERDPATYDEIDGIGFDGSFSDGSFSGRVSVLLVTYGPGNGADGTVSGEVVDIATFESATQ